MAFILYFLWGICIICSLMGWGTIINNILYPNHRFHWAQRVVFGTSLCILVGGILNLTWLISKTTVLLLLAPGFLFCLFDLLKNKHLIADYLSSSFDLCRKEKSLLLFLCPFFILFFLRYIESMGSWAWYLTNDDWRSYLILVKKMLQTGSMGPDPFDIARTSSLGGNAFLQTLVSSMIPIRNVQFIDRGLGLLLSVGLLWEYLKRKNVSKKMSVSILILFLLLPPCDTNTTSLTLAIAFFLSLFNMLSWKGLKNNHFAKNATIIALVASGLCSLKNSFIPTCVLFIILTYIFHLISSKEKKKEALYEFCLSTFLIGAFLLPWMISMYQSSGTLLFPLLGHGYHGSVYGDYLLPYSWVTTSRAFQILFHDMRLEDPAVFIVLTLLLLSEIITRTWKVIDREAVLSFSVSATIGIISTYIALDGIAGYRSTNAIFMPAIFVLLVNASARFENSGKLVNFKNMLISWVVAGILLVSFFRTRNIFIHPLIRYKRILMFAEMVVSGEGESSIAIVSDQTKDMYRRLQEAIPEGETVLERLVFPYLLDFERNKIFFIKAPGSFSPPPGMPFFKGGEKLAEYLLSQSIRYVAFAYAREGGFTRKQYAKRLKWKKYAWGYTMARHNFNFNDNLMELMSTRKVIFDDGENFILDLAQKRETLNN